MLPEFVSLLSQICGACVGVYSSLHKDALRSICDTHVEGWIMFSLTGHLVCSSACVRICLSLRFRVRVCACVCVCECGVSARDCVSACVHVCDVACLFVCLFVLLLLCCASNRASVVWEGFCMLATLTTRSSPTARLQHQRRFRSSLCPWCTALHSLSTFMHRYPEPLSHHASSLIAHTLCYLKVRLCLLAVCICVQLYVCMCQYM
jgi:hypothetical protein